MIKVIMIIMIITTTGGGVVVACVTFYGLIAPLGFIFIVDKNTLI
jgi:hypothetical protein